MFSQFSFESSEQSRPVSGIRGLRSRCMVLINRSKGGGQVLSTRVQHIRWVFVTKPRRARGRDKCGKDGIGPGRLKQVLWRPLAKQGQWDKLGRILSDCLRTARGVMQEIHLSWLLKGKGRTDSLCQYNVYSWALGASMIQGSPDKQNQQDAYIEKARYLL